MIGFFSSFNTNYNPLTINLGRCGSVGVCGLASFLPALKFQSLTGMIDVKCMTVVLISACVSGDLERRVWEKKQGASFRNQRCSLVASGGMLCSSDRIVSPSVVNALLLQLSPSGDALDVRWLLYNVHSHT